MSNPPAQLLRDQIDQNTLATDAHGAKLREMAGLDPAARRAITARAAGYVREIRASADPGLMEVFLAQYGLSTDEGIALMCLAEALLRVPDAETIDALIEDKIAPSDWGKHLGQSSSSLVNASTWALLLTGRVLDDEKPGIIGPLRGAIRRLGEPVIRRAVGQAMKVMGQQFVLGETIKAAMARGAKMEAEGFTYSFDMLGEAARTEADAQAYLRSYSDAIAAIGARCSGTSAAKNPGISVKLSALHPRYEVAQEARVMSELVPRLLGLARQAKSAGMALTIDAEEADRLALSLDVIEAVLSHPSLAGWDGFGVVVQAFGPRAPFVIDWLYDLAGRTGTRIMVRLVKGAYWDAEIKRAQVLGLPGFPVFTSKALTDVSYLANARKLLGLTDRIYPQFATHNAHTVAGVLHMAEGAARDAFEFQRLHGMGEAMHRMVLRAEGTRCRIYAPVGAHEDLLAYLVRRLLENGANSSFVNQITDEDIAPEIVAADPFDAVGDHHPLATGPELFAPERANSVGWDLTDRSTLATLDAGREACRATTWQAGPMLAQGVAGAGEAREVVNPARAEDLVGTVRAASPAEVGVAFGAATPWGASATERAAILNKVADAYETHAYELFAMLQREAGKTLADAVGELREAVDFLRYYAGEAVREIPTARGIWGCISPWNFPLAIFTGQIAAALAAGNAVLSKPAEQTPLIAHRAVELMHEAGVPRAVIQLLPGDGSVGAAVTSDARLGGLAFTGSTATALRIRATMAAHCAPGTPLIAETGGINAMIVDSTALPEAAVRDILASAFQSAGQRCSALRCLYVQDDVAAKVVTMLKGAMDELAIGDPWALPTDIGPVIDDAARAGILAHIEEARADGRVLHERIAPNAGIFVGPTLIKVGGIADLTREIFGPVLHVATFKAEELDDVIAAVNATGYGLTFGLHTRIDDRVQTIVDKIAVGNTYVNRNQIGAVVGSQPFGGEGLSGTGPKAGGPLYMPRFAAAVPGSGAGEWDGPEDIQALEARLGAAEYGPPREPVDLPGPTGESNRLSQVARGPVLCLGPGAKSAAAQVAAIEALGGVGIAAQGVVPPAALERLAPLASVLWWGDVETARACEAALAGRDGPIVALIVTQPDAAHACHERHVCIDTTAAGGNAALLAEISAGPA